ncbi:carbohydrate ABC transporter permease [Gynuella sunshinyii]|uniref:ABC-type sugar transport system, permease component n=1 Tax=Gynuella sunshinyii YC6258 TaxID=1445510 RepID=A0A0C5UYW0_9GAMM|nr:carbohydrate ABC transporter permease [Gynuella sunshinyii]AJQ92515.1 ABC-type sugar transport system, permease component [Gynuella sunshinyii YC6258]
MSIMGGGLHRMTMGKALKHATVLFFVLIWSVPTLGLLISSVRDKDQLAISGWWTSLSSKISNDVVRMGSADDQQQQGDHYIITGSVFEGNNKGTVLTFGFRSDELDAYKAGETADIGKGQTLLVTAAGEYTLSSSEAFTSSRGKRLFFVAKHAPRFTFENYHKVLTSEGIGRAFVNSATVTLPATFIPILIAAFTAYALAWIDFKGRATMLALVVGLLVVPLQMSLIPVLRLYNEVGGYFGFPAKSYPGIWLAHTAFGLPLAIYLLRNYMAGLPKEIMESARMDGASHFQIFRTIVLPLSVPALASFAIFQFLWVWNDLLVSLVFLGIADDKTVMTAQLKEMLGSRGNNWELLTSGAFITMIVPLIVFFSLQRFFVRGLLAGSVKGG